MSRTPKEELVHFLSDLYSMELQAVVQMEKAPDLAVAPELADDFRAHLEETREQAARVGARLEALGGSSSGIKDAIMKLGGKGFVLFARLQPETPGKLVAHSYAYEAMEAAGYEVLVRLAEHAADTETAALARELQGQERKMLQRLENYFDIAEEVSHRETPVEEIPKHVQKHLAEAHALEEQSIQLLSKAPEIAGDSELAEIYSGHFRETRAQAAAVEQRLKTLGSSPSLIEDAALRIGALNWGLFFQAQKDTPAKLAAFAYAVEHLEIAAYELLKRTARRIGDSETVELCEQILTEERAMTGRLADAIGRSVQATLDVPIGKSARPGTPIS